jgi:hypothetical protein
LAQALCGLFFEPLVVTQIVRPRGAVTKVHFVIRFAQNIPL